MGDILKHEVVLDKGHLHIFLAWHLWWHLVIVGVKRIVIREGILVWFPWASHLTSLCFSFLSHKMWIRKVCTSLTGCCGLKQVECVTSLEGHRLFSKSFVGVSYSHYSMPVCFMLLGAGSKPWFFFISTFSAVCCHHVSFEVKGLVTSLWIRKRERSIVFHYPVIYIADSWTKHL